MRVGVTAETIDGKSWELHVHELAHFSKDSTSE